MIFQRYEKGVKEKYYCAESETHTLAPLPQSDDQAPNSEVMFIATPLRMILGLFQLSSQKSTVTI